MKRQELRFCPIFGEHPSSLSHRFAEGLDFSISSPTQTHHQGFLLLDAGMSALVFNVSPWGKVVLSVLLSVLEVP